jgi:hypothetical protein
MFKGTAHDIIKTPPQRMALETFGVCASFGQCESYGRFARFIGYLKAKQLGQHRPSPSRWLARRSETPLAASPSRDCRSHRLSHALSALLYHSCGGRVVDIVCRFQSLQAVVVR